MARSRNSDRQQTVTRRKVEQPEKYLAKPLAIDIPISDDKRERVLNSAYFQCVASTADSMIASGWWKKNIFYDDLIEEAIAFTDKLIEKVGKKL